MTAVEVDQVWELSQEPGGRCRCKVLAVEGSRALVQFQRSGRVSAIQTSTLAMGRRGARLVLLPDGAPAPDTRSTRNMREERARRAERERVTAEVDDDLG